jgi:hypothetical protein
MPVGGLVSGNHCIQAQVSRSASIWFSQTRQPGNAGGEASVLKQREAAGHSGTGGERNDFGRGDYCTPDRCRPSHVDFAAAQARTRSALAGTDVDILTLCAIPPLPSGRIYQAMRGSCICL